MAKDKDSRSDDKFESSKASSDSTKDSRSVTDRSASTTDRIKDGKDKDLRHGGHGKDDRDDRDEAVSARCRVLAPVLTGLIPTPCRCDEDDEHARERRARLTTRRRESSCADLRPRARTI